jgi:hypothetical protein
MKTVYHINGINFTDLVDVFDYLNSNGYVMSAVTSGVINHVIHYFIDVNSL